MALIHKIVSDWNLKTDLEGSAKTGGVTTVSEDSSFSTSALGGSYDIVVDGGVVRGVFSASGSYTINYFTYEDAVASSGIVTVNGAEVTGVNPRIVVDGSDIYVLYYDTNSFAVSVLKNSGGSWQKTFLDYVIMPVAPNFRQIDFRKVGSDIVGAYVYSFSSTEKSVKYIEMRSGKWIIDSVTLGDDQDINTVYVHKRGNIPLVILGGEDGLSAYKRVSGNWLFLATYSDLSVTELHGAYSDSVSAYHLAYVAGTEIRYQKFNTSTNAFLSKYKFIDFAASSVSVAVNSSDQPIISYSHIEGINPITSFLKIARGESDGLTFRTYNVKSSTIHQYAGYLSDIEVGSSDRIFIAYYDSAVKIYDESLDNSEDEVDTSVWKDRTFVNNLVASPDPPTRDAENTYMEFSREDQNYFYIENDSQLDLDEQATGFSIALSIIPNGESTYAQNIVSKISSTGSGYELFLGGTNGLWVGFTLSTMYGSVQSLVAELPANEVTKIAMVYSGFDVKIYVKRPSDGSFVLSTYAVAGDLKKNGSPFVIGALGVKNQSLNPYYPYQSIDTHTFSNFLDAKILGVKYWQRELTYEEATYGDVVGEIYKQSSDPYSDGLDYSTVGSPVADMHFFLDGENFSSKDYGGVGSTELLRHSNYNLEERITNAAGYSIDPVLAKKRDGSISVVWSDKRSGFSEIYINEFYGNNAISSIDQRMSTVKTSGCNGAVVSSTNIFTDTNGKFLDRGVYVGDFLNITSGDKYQGKKVPIIGVISNTALEIGAYFSQDGVDIGYFIDFREPTSVDDYAVKISNLQTTSLNPSVAYDSIGDAHIVFQSLGSEYYSIYYSRYRSSLNSNQIRSPLQLTNADGNSSEPSIGIDSSDSIHIVWSDTRNESKSIFYARSSAVTDFGEAKFPYWSSGNLGGSDRLISSDIYGDKANILVDSRDTVHIVFSGRVTSSDDSKREIFYVDNIGGKISNPVRITHLDGRATSPRVVEDSSGNKYVIFSAKTEDYYNVYIMKRIASTGMWQSPKRVSATTGDSSDPSACVDSDGVVYIYWVEKSSGGNSMGYAEYISAEDRIVNDRLIRVSSASSNILAVSSILDETKTVYVSWEDDRENEEGETEIYKNESINLVTFDEQEEDTEGSRTLTEIVSDQMSRAVIGMEFSDIVSPSELPLSDESMNEVEISLYTDNVTYTIPFSLSNVDNVDILNQTVSVDYRKIGIKIKGLNRTIAYRIKNADDASAKYSEFFEFTVDEPPNTTIGSWTLSPHNGQKQVCVQLYTIRGLTSEFCIDLFLNEPNLFDISIHSDDSGNVGEVVDTEYREVKALKSNRYWVKILPHKLLTEDQTIVFDIETQGETYSNIQTEKDGGYFIGRFAINTQDGIRHIDGSAKIIPRIVSQ